MTPPFKFLRLCDDEMLCERCQRFDIQAFGRDPYPYRGVPLHSVISSNHCSFCSLLLESLRTVEGNLNIHDGGWVNFAVTKATKQPVAGSRGLNIASIDAFLGYVDLGFFRFGSFRYGSFRFRDPKRVGYVKFHVAADPGEMPLFSISDPGTDSIVPK